MYKQLLGFDNHGKVFDFGCFILRKIDADYEKALARIYREFERNNLAKLNIVKTRKISGNELFHEKLIISYPYEWTDSMIKDALLLHVELLIKLSKFGLTLKDGLPNNILFKYTTPVYIDFLSLVFIGDLKNEAWLNSQGLTDSRYAVLHSMLFPFFVLPLLMLARGHYKAAVEILSYRSCNCGSSTPSWKELFKKNINGKNISFAKYSSSIYLWIKITIALVVAKHKMDGFNQFMSFLKKSIENCNLPHHGSAYACYYAEKDEDVPIDDIKNFSAKQSSIFNILRSKQPKTILDIGANTGWYSFLGSSLGANVIAIEQDRVCADIIYRKAKSQNLNILPLCIAFKSLTQEIFPISSPSNTSSVECNQTIPLYARGTDRLSCELVLALGIVHHLILGEGYTFQELFDIFSEATKETLVVEFIDFNDDKIINEPGFFGQIEKHDENTYNVNVFLSASASHFDLCEILNSIPNTRKIFVFKKKTLHSSNMRS